MYGDYYIFFFFAGLIIYRLLFSVDNNNNRRVNVLGDDDEERTHTLEPHKYRWRCTCRFRRLSVGKGKLVFPFRQLDLNFVGTRYSDDHLHTG